jgi:hypothetical protein
MKKILLGLFGSLLTLSSTSAHAVGSELYPGEWLLQPQRLVASGCYYHLEMQADAHLVLYAGSQAIWDSDNAPFACNAFFPCPAVNMQGDGNLVLGLIGAAGDTGVGVPTGEVDWSSDSWGHNGAFLSLRNDGNLVIKDVAGTVFWQSNTAGEVVAQSPCNRFSRTTKMQRNRDRPGSDFHSFEMPNNSFDVGLCGKVCALDSQCTAFAMKRINTTTVKCWLKNAIPASVSATGVWSGHIRSLPSCTEAERTGCGAFGCGCVDHQCSGGNCPGTGCSDEDNHACAAFGCFCSLGQCTGGMCG